MNLKWTIIVVVLIAITIFLFLAVQNETKESDYAFHGYHMTILNVSESEFRDTPRNSTLEDLADRGYEIISITADDIEKYSYLKEGMNPGYVRGQFRRTIKDEEKDEFFERFYGKCFSYRGYNYSINMYKN